MKRDIDELSLRNNIRQQIKSIGDNPTRTGVIDTPARVVKSWKHLYSGYQTKVEDVFTVFEEKNIPDEMILLKDIEFYSTCEHHLLPFFGKAHIAYVPGEKIIGISKLARILEVFARRLQIQERICDQVTNALMDHLNPQGAACIIEAQHFCMMSRGIQKQNSVMVTSSLKGVFLNKIEARNELTRLIR